MLLNCMEPVLRTEFFFFSCHLLAIRGSGPKMKVSDTIPEPLECIFLSGCRYFWGGFVPSTSLAGEWVNCSSVLMPFQKAATIPVSTEPFLRKPLWRILFLESNPQVGEEPRGLGGAAAAAASRCSHQDTPDKWKRAASLWSAQEQVTGLFDLRRSWRHGPRFPVSWLSLRGVTGRDSLSNGFCPICFTTRILWFLALFVV